MGEIEMGGGISIGENIIGKGLVRGRGIVLERN